MQPTPAHPSKSDDPKLVAKMVGLIAVIHFVIETLVMGMMSNWNLTSDVIQEALLDSTWLTVLSSPLIYLFVARPFIISSRTAENTLNLQIAEQAQQADRLESLLRQQSDTLAVNTELQSKLERSNKLIAELNERTLQQISADLHDGPAQLITYCLLRLDKLEPASAGADPERPLNIERIRGALSDILSEVRGLCAGLSLPQLSSLSIAGVIKAAILQHEEQTGTRVDLSLQQDIPKDCAQAKKVCVYRVIQESLTNSYKHARGSGQRVNASWDKHLIVEVSDAGSGFLIEDFEARGLGIAGMHARAEGLGGSLKVTSSPDGGTTVTLRLDVSNE